MGAFCDSNHLIEKVNDEIDEIPLFEFWLKWTVCPSYPIYQIARKFDSHTYADDLLEFNFLFQSVAETVAFILLLIKLAHGNVSAFVLETLSFMRLAVLAPLSYYVIYWFVPNFINSIFFYLTVYVLLPVKCLAALAALALAAASVLAIGAIRAVDRAKDA